MTIYSVSSWQDDAEYSKYSIFVSQRKKRSCQKSDTSNDQNFVFFLEDIWEKKYRYRFFISTCFFFHACTSLICGVYLSKKQFLFNFILRQFLGQYLILILTTIEFVNNPFDKNRIATFYRSFFRGNKPFKSYV